MMFYYLDSSALVKYYIKELGSLRIRALVGSHEHRIWISELTVVEIAAVFGRLYREGRIREPVWHGLLDHFMDDIASGRYDILRTLAEDFFDAVLLTRRHPLKAGDAIQLAVALRLRRILSPHQHRLTFVTSDRILRAAAEAEGLIIEDPEERPPQPNL